MFAPVGLGDWFVTILVAGIPLVGIIMLFIWAFGSSANPSKANWAKAMLLWTLVGIVIAVIIFAIVGTAFFHAMSTE
jgi:heme/copper-type cytochrome/quinol oxidase subunit 2